MQTLQLVAFELSKHGDEREQELWPNLSARFPSYELLWRRLIVPLTNRVDKNVSYKSAEWIDLRLGVPDIYEEISMSQYSVFYFLGRAAQRLQCRSDATKQPEDVFFLLGAVRDNFLGFRKAMNKLLTRQTCAVIFEEAKKDLPAPFHEIADYRNSFLHNPLLGRILIDGRTHLPKWGTQPRNPLEPVSASWRKLRQLTSAELVPADDLLDRLLIEACQALDQAWKRAFDTVTQPSFQERFLRDIGLPTAWELPALPAVGDYSFGANASYSGSVALPAMLPFLSTSGAFEGPQPSFRNTDENDET